MKSGYLIAVIIVVVDQIIKITIAGSVTNPGIGLGIFANYQLVNLVLDLGMLIALVAFNILLIKSPKLKLLVYMVVIIGCSNLADRVRVGQVIDYLHVGPIVFNLADLSICILVLLILWQLYISNESRSFFRKSRK